MKKLFIAIALSLAAGTTSVKAQEDLSKQLEVTRAYTPRVDQAVKLPVVPDMTDTVRLRPEISYRITSTASATSFVTRPFEAATVSAAPFEIWRPLYLRAGVGAPFQSELDLYYTPRSQAGSSFGIFANHSGSYSKITNDLGIEADATETTNGAGIWGTKQWWRYSLEADVTYDNRLYNPYGVADIDHDPTSSVRQVREFVYDKQMHRFSLGLARAGVSFGDNFTDLSRLNFRIGVDGGYAHGHLNSPNSAYKQINFDARITAAQMFGEGRHGFELVLAENGAFDTSGRVNEFGAKMDLVSVSFMPSYLLVSNNVRLKAGLDVRYIINKGHYQNYGVYSPVFEVSANYAGGAFVPFASYTSRIADGDIESLSRLNPYVVTGGKSAWINDGRIGFSGDLSDVFSYKLSGGVSLLREYQLFVGSQVVRPRDADGATGVDYPPMWFEPVGADGSRFTAGAEIGVHNLGGFGARLYGNWNKFSFRRYVDSSFHPVGDLPKFDAGVELSYSYKDIFALRFGAEFIGERRYLVRANSSQSPDPRYTVGTIAPVVDITFGADVRVARDFWIFLEGENLADQVLYPYPHYRGLGASVMGGIKIVF